MSDAVIIALATGPVVLIIDRAITWARTRKKDDAEAGLTIDQRWQAWADELKDEITALRSRVESLEQKLGDEREQRKSLTAEVDRYKRIAKSLARHVLRLRDELAKANVQTPVLPTDVEEALTIIELP